MKDLKIAAFVPAKSSSERVKSKNMRILDGQYLFVHKLNQLLLSKYVTEVWLDTDSDLMIDIVSNLPVKILKRDKKLASNQTDGHELFANECASVPDADIVIQALCTAPFLDTETIDYAIKDLIHSAEYDSSVAITSEKLYLWEDNKPKYGMGRIPNSIDVPETFIESMSLYIMKNSSKHFGSKRIGEKPKLFQLTGKQSIDINYDHDLQLCQDIFLAKRAEEQNYFNLVKHHLSSPIISDVTKEMGLNCSVDRKIQLMTKGKILGRAKTLRLRALRGEELDIKNNENWKGIYRALETYKFMSNGDIICVENELKDKAYFGDLNAHLALKAGVSGVIVDGVTRDTAAVTNMDLPVYARGKSGVDVKYEGTVDSYNQPIGVGGQSVKNGDIIFADAEGVFVIKHEIWEAVLENILTTLETENNIRNGLLFGVDSQILIERYGYF